MEPLHARSNSFTFIINNYEHNPKKAFDGANVLKRCHSDYNFSNHGYVKNQWTLEDDSQKVIQNKKRQRNFVGTGSFNGRTGTDLFQNVIRNSKKRRNRIKNSSLKINSSDVQSLNNHYAISNHKKKRRKPNYGTYDVNNKYEIEADKQNCILNNSESSIEKRDTDLFYFDIGRNEIDKSVISERKPIGNKFCIENTENYCSGVNNYKLFKKIHHMSKCQTDVEGEIKETKKEAAFYEKAFDYDNSNCHVVKRERKNKKNDNLSSTLNFVDNIKNESDKICDNGQYLKSEKKFNKSEKPSQSTKIVENVFTIPCKTKKKRKKALNPVIYVSESDCEIIDHCNIKTNSSTESYENFPKRKLKHKATHIQENICAVDNNTTNVYINDIESDNINVENKFKAKKKKHKLCQVNNKSHHIENNMFNRDDLHYKNKKPANTKKKHKEEYCSKDSIESEGIVKSLNDKKKNKKSKIKVVSRTTSEDECEIIDYVGSNSKKRKKHTESDIGIKKHNTVSMRTSNNNNNTEEILNTSEKISRRNNVYDAKTEKSLGIEETVLHNSKKQNKMKKASNNLQNSPTNLHLEKDNLNNYHILKEERNLDSDEITHERKDIPHGSHIIFNDNSSDSSEIITSEYKYRKTNTKIETDTDSKPLIYLNKSNTTMVATNRINLYSKNETTHKLPYGETKSITFEGNNLKKIENGSKSLGNINLSYFKKEDQEHSIEFNNFEYPCTDISDKTSISKNKNKKNKMKHSETSTEANSELIITKFKKKKKRNISYSTEPHISSSDEPVQTEKCALAYIKKSQNLEKVCNKQSDDKLYLAKSLKKDNHQDDKLESCNNILQEQQCLPVKSEIDLEVHDETSVTNVMEDTIAHPNNLDNKPMIVKQKQKQKKVIEKIKDNSSLDILDGEYDLLDNINSVKKKKRKCISSVEIDVQSMPKKKHKTAVKNEVDNSSFKNNNSQEEYDLVKPKGRNLKSSSTGDNTEIQIILEKLNTEKLIKDEFSQNIKLENCDNSLGKCLISDNDARTYKKEGGNENHNFEKNQPSDGSKMISTCKHRQHTEIFEDAKNPTDIGVATHETVSSSRNETVCKSEIRTTRASTENRKKKCPIRRSSVFAQLMEQEQKTTKSEKQTFIPVISTDPDDIEDDIEKLKDLTVLFPFSIPPLHALAYRTSVLTKADLDKIQEMNLPIKSGPFTKEEDKMIIDNWKQLCNQHGLRMDPSIFIKFPKKLKMEIKVNILRYIAHGLDDRLLHRVYVRFRSLLQKNQIKTGRYTPEEDRTLLEFMANTNSDHPFSDVAKILNRTSCSAEVRYKRLTSNNKVIHWTTEMVDRLVKALMKITKCEKVKQLKLRKFTPKEWSKLSKKLDNIPIIKLKRAWNVTIYPRLFCKEKDIREIKEELIHVLCDRNETNWKKVNWKEIAKYFKGCTPEQIYAIFRHMTYFHVPQDKHSDLKECLKFLKYRVLRYDIIRTAHKFRKFVIRNGEVTYDEDSD